MTIDVLLPFYGDVDHLQLAVRSVLRQNYAEWRLSIFDDAHPDPEVKRWCTSISDPRVTYERNIERLGANKNFRKALATARGDLVVFMGADDIMLPNYLETVANDFAVYPEVDVVQPGVHTIDARGSSRYFLTDYLKKLYAPRVMDHRMLTGEQMATSLLRANWTYFPSLAWKRKTVQNIGFTKGLNVAQDLALLLDTAAAGGSLLIDPTLAFLYRRHSASDSSVRAVDGSRFTEEKVYFQQQAKRFSALGWKSAARAAAVHSSSRLHAAACAARAVQQGNFSALSPCLKHLVL